MAAAFGVMTVAGVGILSMATTVSGLVPVSVVVVVGFPRGGGLFLLFGGSGS